LADARYRYVDQIWFAHGHKNVDTITSL